MKNHIFLFLVTFLIWPTLGIGQNFLGGYIHAKRIAPTTSHNYSITVQIYVQGPVNSNTYIHIDWGDQSAPDSLLCTGTSNLSGSIKKIIVTGLHTYQPNQLYQISVVEKFYVPNVLNIPNSGTQKLQLRYGLNTTVGANTSATPSFPLVDSSSDCSIEYNPGLFDDDGDSLSLTLTSPTIVSNYITPSATLQSVGTMTVSAAFFSYIAVSLKVEEWRKATLNGPYIVISTSYLELMFIICTSNPVNLAKLKNEHEVHIYPNPVLNELICDFSDVEITELRITDLLGQLVYIERNPTSKEKISVDHLSNGIYLLRLQNESGQKIFRIVKE